MGYIYPFSNESVCLISPTVYLKNARVSYMEALRSGIIPSIDVE